MASISYHCGITRHPKTQQCKTIHVFIISWQGLWIKDPGMTQLGLRPLQSLLQARLKTLAGAVASSRLTRGGICFQARAHGYGQGSVSCRLIGRRLPSVLAQWISLQIQSGALMRASRWKKPEKECQRGRCQSFITSSQRGHPIPLAVFQAQEASHQLISNSLSFYS